MRVKTPMCQTRNGYLRSEGKEAFLVQRGRSAISRRRKSHLLTSSADLTHLVSSGGRPETRAIPVFHRIVPNQTLINYFVNNFFSNFF